MNNYLFFLFLAHYEIVNNDPEGLTAEQKLSKILGKKCKSHNQDFVIWLEDNKIFLKDKFRIVSHYFYRINFLLFQERAHLNLYSTNKWDPIKNPHHAAFLAKYHKYTAVVEDAHPCPFSRQELRLCSRVVITTLTQTRVRIQPVERN